MFIVIHSDYNSKEPANFRHLIPSNLIPTSISLFSSIYTNNYREFNLNSMDKQPKKLLEQVRDRPRLKHFSIGTEDSYLPWIRSLTLTNSSIIT